ncbi:MAG: ATP-dependent sacrificial sulfur transferase LarE [Lentisphaeria bacterium]|nr:ATP-dependent sacrificial sulfur transferase LarE [Lentisphaeria bacterium]
MTLIEELKAFLRRAAEHGGALAFSGGVDSSFLLALLKEIHDETPFPLTALTMRTVFQAEEELSEVRRIAAETGVELQVFSCDPLSLPEVRDNPPDRCYWCKRHIFTEFLKFCRTNGLGVLFDGTNADDLKVYRPGLRALRELGVVSPLAELGFTKAEIRRLARERGLACASKPSQPCLATRFEYGTHLRPELLESVRRGEALIRGLLPAGTDVRLRVHLQSVPLARIEVSPDAMAVVFRHREELASALQELGFQFITLDLEGFRSGCYDQKKEKEP